MYDQFLLWYNRFSWLYFALLLRDSVVIVNNCNTDILNFETIFSTEVWHFSRSFLLFYFTIKGFRTIVFIFVISITFWPICPPTFFRCLSNSGTYTELRITFFIESMRVTCFDSISHNPCGFNKGCSSKFRVSSQVWQTPEESRWTYWPKCCGNNNKDEDNCPNTLYDKSHQASSQKFRELIFYLIVVGQKWVVVWIFSFKVNFSYPFFFFFFFFLAKIILCR